MAKTQEEPTANPTPKQTLIEKFMQEYNDICTKYCLSVGYQPMWVQSNDTGDWRLAIQLNIQRFTPPNKKGNNVPQESK